MNRERSEPDPFYLPVSIRGEEIQSALTRHIQSLIPAEWHGKAVMIVTLAKHPKSVADATGDGRCDRCGEAAWLSPSSKRLSTPCYRLCMDCGGPQLRKLLRIQFGLEEWKQ